MREIPRDPMADGSRGRGRMPERRAPRRDDMMRNTSSQNWRDKVDGMQNSPRDLPRRDEK